MPDPLYLFDRLAQVVSSHASAGPFLDEAAKELNSRLRDADQKLSDTIVRFFVAWTAFSAIGTGFLSQGSFSSFQIADARGALLVAPPLLGFLNYLIRAYGRSIDLLGGR